MSLVACGILVTEPGTKTISTAWKHGALITGLPGESPQPVFPIAVETDTALWYGYHNEYSLPLSEGSLPSSIIHTDMDGWLQQSMSMQPTLRKGSDKSPWEYDPQGSYASKVRMKTPTKALQVIAKRIVLGFKGTSAKNEYKKKVCWGEGVNLKKIKMTSFLSVATIYFKQIFYNLLLSSDSLIVLKNPGWKKYLPSKLHNSAKLQNLSSWRKKKKLHGAILSRSLRTLSTIFRKPQLLGESRFI